MNDNIDIVKLLTKYGANWININCFKENLYESAIK